MKGVLTWLCVTALVPTLMLRGQQAAGDFERPVDHYAYAQGLMKGKVYDFAEKAFANFLKAYPTHELASAAHANLIDCLRRQEKHEEMLTSIDEFRKKWPTHANVEVFTFWEGESYLQRKRVPQARECFEKLQDAKNPTLKEYSMFLLASCLFAEDPSSERGYELYAKIAQLPLQENTPFREQAQYKLGKKYQYDMKYTEALPLFRRLAGHAKGLPAIREDAMFSEGEIHYAMRNYTEARTAYDRYLTVFPNGKWANEVRKRRASAVYLMEQYETALKMILEWRAANPGKEDYEVDCLQGRCLYSMGEYMTAWPHFEVVFKNEAVQMEMRRFCLVHGIHCLLSDDKKASWERGLELSGMYFKQFCDANYENKVYEFEARLQENLGHYEQALSGYDRTLKGLGDNENSRKIQIMLRKIQCCQALKRWQEAAAQLRKLSAEPECAAEKVRYTCGAGELELKSDGVSAAAEADFLKALGYKEISGEQATACHERLLEIYTRRKDHAKAHQQLDVLLKNATGERREQYLYRDAWVLDEMDRCDEAILRLREALGKTAFTDEKREVSMRLLLLKLLQEKLNAGDQSVSGDVLAQYRILSEKPDVMTEQALTPPVLYHLARLLEKQMAEKKNQAERGLLEKTCSRAVAKGYDEPTAVWAGYRLGCLYAASEDGRYKAAAALFEQLRDTLTARLEDKEKNADYLRQLQDAEYLLHEALSWLCVCYFHLGRDADAQTTAEMVQKRSKGYAATRRCLLIQARIYYERRPQNLKMAREKLIDYHYIIPKEAVDPAEEEEATVLLMKVQKDMGLHEEAQATFRDLKVRYPKRVAKETWMSVYDKDKTGNKQ